MESARNYDTCNAWWQFGGSLVIFIFFPSHLSLEFKHRYEIIEFQSKKNKSKLLSIALIFSPLCVPSEKYFAFGKFLMNFFFLFARQFIFMWIECRCFFASAPSKTEKKFYLCERFWQTWKITQHHFEASALEHEHWGNRKICEAIYFLCCP